MLNKVVLGLCVCMVMCGMIDATSFQAATLKSTTIESTSKFNNDWEEKIVYYNNGTTIGRMKFETKM